MNKLLGLVICSLFVQTAYALTCPTIEAIRQNNIAGWKAFDSEEGTPLPPNRFNKFRNNVKQFAVAEWNEKKGIVHCFYRTEDGSNLNAYLSKGTFMPSNNQHLWYPVSGSLQCAASTDKCQFRTNQLNTPSQFAEKEQPTRVQ